MFRGDFDVQKVLDIFPSLPQHFTRGVHEALVYNLKIHIIDSGETVVHFSSQEGLDHISHAICRLRVEHEEFLIIAIVKDY